MQLSPFQLGLLVVGGFATIIGLSVLGKYQSNEAFREGLSNAKPTDLFKIRARRIAEENLETVPSENYAEADNSDD